MEGLELLKKVAEGSAVEAYLAKSGDDHVLVQVSRPELVEDMELYGRFLDSTRQSTNRSHPALLSAASTHCSDDGRFIVVSQPVLGRTAADWLVERGPLETSRAVVWGATLCEALSFLHDSGVTHGNLSPGHVFLDGDPVDPLPRLLDTGLLLFRAGRSLKTPQVLVAPEYLSPERVSGQRASSASDIYGMGVLLFELLTGQPPFRGPTPEETRVRHLLFPLPEVPEALSAWAPFFARCLAKDPVDRFASVNDVRCALLELSDEEAPVVLGTAVASPTVAATGPIVPIALEVAPGAVLGSYVVEKLLGEGGMGRVFLANHVVLGRKVALKVMRQELVARPDQVRRFVQEAQAVNQVRHPNIVEVSDLVQESAEQGGRVYFVMELLEGQSVRDAARDTPFSLPRALGVVRQAAEALAAAHAVGVVHRDIKPDNLFLTRGADGKDLVKVLDFGVARMGLGLPGFSRSTMVGQVVGTPLWMAPEQLLGREVDARADVYGLGMVLYVLLARKFPYEGATMDEVVLDRLANEAALLGVTTTLGETVSQGLRDLIAECLARNLKKRPASMTVVAERLRMLEVAPAVAPQVLYATPAPVAPARVSQVVRPTPSRGVTPAGLAEHFGSVKADSDSSSLRAVFAPTKMDRPVHRPAPVWPWLVAAAIIAAASAAATWFWLF